MPKLPGPVKPGQPVIGPLNELRDYVASLRPVAGPGTNVVSTPGGTTTSFEQAPRFPAIVTSRDGASYSWSRQSIRGGSWVSVPGWSGVAREINGSTLATPFRTEVWLDPSSRKWFFQLSDCGGIA